MIGPQKQKMPDKLVCLGCDCVISQSLGGTPRFPDAWVVNYCSHNALDTEVAVIKDFPYTPKWCPALDKPLDKGGKGE